LGHLRISLNFGVKSDGPKIPLYMTKRKIP
jgi:hypothetical protein